MDSAPADTGGLNAGLCVLRDASDGKLRAPATEADVARVEGVTRYSETRTPYSETVLWGPDIVTPFLREGSIWVTTEGTVSTDDDVFIRHTAKGANTVLGSVRSGSDRNAVTAAVVEILETDANVDNGDYLLAFRLVVDGVPGDTLTAQFTASTTSHAALAAGLKASIELLADVTATAGSEAADIIPLTIVVDATTDVLAAVEVVQLTVPSTGTEMSVGTQGAENPTAAVNPSLRFREGRSGAGITPLDVMLA
jgi:hypothetical protein